MKTIKSYIQVWILAFVGCMSGMLAEKNNVHAVMWAYLIVLALALVLIILLRRHYARRTDEIEEEHN